MAQNKNLYEFKTPKSGNEETGFLNIKGRINRTAFFLRLLLTIGIFAICFLIYDSGMYARFGSRMENFYETCFFYLLPVFLLAFLFIQAAKRAHDTNQSAWYILIPFYNLYIIFSPGTKGNNDFGLDPTPIKNIQYFDELELNTPLNEPLDINKNLKKPKGNNYKFIILIALFCLGLIGYYNFYLPNYGGSAIYEEATRPVDESNSNIEENTAPEPAQATATPTAIEVEPAQGTIPTIDTDIVDTTEY